MPLAAARAPVRCQRHVTAQQSGAGGMATQRAHRLQPLRTSACYPGHPEQMTYQRESHLLLHPFS